MSLLEADALVAGYGRVPVLHGIDLKVDEGELLTVIGANGAGKSTLMRTIAGLVRPMGGTVHFDGKVVSRTSPRKLTRMGLAHVPENRRVFGGHTVEENLVLGAYAQRGGRGALRPALNEMYDKFTILGERRRQPAGSLSGGEQQMLAIAMALMAKPRLLMLDEPSLGLAPIIVQRVFAEIAALRTEGTTILLNEQLANLALELADRALVLHLGRVIVAGTPPELRRDDAIRRAYLGGTALTPQARPDRDNSVTEECGHDQEG